MRKVCGTIACCYGDNHEDRIVRLEPCWSGQLGWLALRSCAKTASFRCQRAMLSFLPCEVIMPLVPVCAMLPSLCCACRCTRPAMTRVCQSAMCPSEVGILVLAPARSLCRGSFVISAVKFVRKRMPFEDALRLVQQPEVSTMAFSPALARPKQKMQQTPALTTATCDLIGHVHTGLGNQCKILQGPLQQG